MTTINHITLNTGHSRKSYVSEIDKSLWFEIQNIIKQAQTKKGVELFDNSFLL